MLGLNEGDTEGDLDGDNEGLKLGLLLGDKDGDREGEKDPVGLYSTIAHKSVGHTSGLPSVVAAPICIFVKEFVPVITHSTPVVGSVCEINGLPKAVVLLGLVLTVALPASLEVLVTTAPPEADFSLNV